MSSIDRRTLWQAICRSYISRKQFSGLTCFWSSIESRPASGLLQSSELFLVFYRGQTFFWSSTSNRHFSVFFLQRADLLLVFSEQTSLWYFTEIKPVSGRLQRAGLLQVIWQRADLFLAFYRKQICFWPSTESRPSFGLLQRANQFLVLYREQACFWSSTENKKERRYSLSLPQEDLLQVFNSSIDKRYSVDKRPYLVLPDLLLEEGLLPVFFKTFVD